MRAPLQENDAYSIARTSIVDLNNIEDDDADLDAVRREPIAPSKRDKTFKVKSHSTKGKT